MIPYNSGLVAGRMRKRREKRVREGRSCYSERKFGQGKDGESKAAGPPRRRARLVKKMTSGR